MVKSASIVRNLSKNHTFRTIASILIDTQSRFPANFNWAKPTFPRNLICAIPPFPVNIVIYSTIAGTKINPIGYNYNVIYPQLYPNGIILA